MGEITQRPAEPGERCTCGRQAVVVYLGGAFGPTGWCGRSDGGDRTGPCPFCGGSRHPDRCPDYRLRLDERQFYVAYTVTHGRRADGWWFRVEFAGREPEEHGPYASEDAMLDDKVARTEELEAGIVEP